MIEFIEIAGRKIGSSQPCFIMAEAGVNHNGNLDLAKRLVEIAARAGADAVKFQTFSAQKLVSERAPKADYQIKTTDPSESQLEMIRRLELSPSAHRELQDHCRALGIMFLSTPFDEEAADFLFELDVPAFKIGSGDLTHLPLLDYVARKGRPVILSTGMATMDEVAQAVETIRGGGCKDLILLHCVSSYPADPADANLRAMQTMARAFQLPVGYSDHTLGVEVALAAVALGACVVEKHFTLNRSLPGPDHHASLEPDELRRMVEGIRAVEAALGDGQKRRTDLEIDMSRVARRSLIAACDIPAGATLTEEMISIKRPGTGLPPAMRNSVIGRRVRRQVESGSPITLEVLD